MNNKFVLISFYTTNTPYKEVIEHYLIKSLKKFPKIKTCMYGMQPKGTWLQNVTLKPEVIEMALDAYKDYNIVFVDADATIEQYPLLFSRIPEQYDIAFHTLNWNTWYGYTQNPPITELLSGTMFFRNTEKVRDLVRKWKIDANTLGIVEQKILQGILKKNQGAYKIYDLPVEYCYIQTHPSGKEPLLKVESPVIVHHQISRKLKKIV